jgi:F-type H+-transporting ATPase subunit delta
MKGGTLVTSEILAPYAQALMAIAQNQNLLDRFNEDAEMLIQTLEGSEEFAQFLANPLVQPGAKKAVLSQLFGDKVHSYMTNFLMLLVDRKRIQFVDGICKQYQSLLRQLRQTVLAEVVSAYDLTDAQKDTVRQKVTEMTGANQVDLETRIDRDILGGVVIKVGSQVIDASLRGQLRRVGLRLTSASGA